MSKSSMYVFTPKSVRSPLNLSCFTDCTKHASAVAPIHRQQEIYWIFYTNKTKQHLQTYKTYCHLMGLNETSRVAYNLGETQTCNNCFFFLRLKLTCTFRSLRSLAKSQCVLRGGTLSSPETLLYPSISN